MTGSIPFIPLGVEATFEHRWVKPKELDELGRVGWEAVCMRGTQILVKRRMLRLRSVVSTAGRQTGGNI